MIFKLALDYLDLFRLFLQSSGDTFIPKEIQDHLGSVQKSLGIICALGSFWGEFGNHLGVKLVKSFLFIYLQPKNGIPFGWSMT